MLFFGREQQVAELMRRLHDQRFVAVVGSSGCGKSSLVRAGVIPKLEAGFLVQERDVWHVRKMKPGDAPIDNLALALTAGAAAEQRELVRATADELRESGVDAALARVSAFFHCGDCNLLLLVDQFEELFGDQAGGAGTVSDDAADFVSIMLDLTQQTEVAVYVIMTMRSDFLGECDRFHGLPEAMNRSQYLVPRLTRQQRREVIEGPVRLYGGDIAPRLTDRLLNESLDTRDDLPVLQHALMRTWDAWQKDGGGPLDVGHYEAIGTIHEALSRDAEAALSGFDKRQLVLTRRLFQSLTKVDAANRHIRRRARLAEVSARSRADAADIWPLVQRFRSDGRSFLVSSSDNPVDNPLLDISHESLIRQWGTLGRWVQEETESIHTYKRLAETAVLKGQGRAGWYRDPDLQVALDWREQESPTEQWAREHHPKYSEAMAFLDASKALRDKDHAEAEFARRWKLPRAMIAVFVIILFFFNLGIPPLERFWKTVDNVVGYVVDQRITGLRTRVEANNPGETVQISEAQQRSFGVAVAEMIHISAHLLLFAGLTRVGKRFYRSYVFRAVSPEAKARPGKLRARGQPMRKLARIIEVTAKWASILVGVLILGSCSFVSASASGGSVLYVLIGLVVALLLVGWVFAAARLNADVKAIRERLQETTPPETAPAAVPSARAQRTLDVESSASPARPIPPD